jgi:long-subunit fatty acid transport protein
MNTIFRNGALACLMAGGFFSAPAALGAQELSQSGWQASVDWVNEIGDMKEMKNGFGYTLGLAYQFNLESHGYRLYLNALCFDSFDGTGFNKQRPHFYGGLDVYTATFFNGDVSFFGGILGMSWNQSPEGVSDPRFTNTPNVGTKFNSVKLGGRAGVEYHINREASVSLAYTVCQGNLAFSPSWLTLGATYRF